MQGLAMLGDAVVDVAKSDLRSAMGEGVCGPGVACGVVPFGSAFEAGPSLSGAKSALGDVHARVGKLPKGEPGKFGSPQRGTSVKGYRLDPGHPHAAPGSAESGWHINWWDYSEFKRSSGQPVSGAVPIRP